MPGHPPFAYAPIDLTALAVVYNMNDPLTTAPIGDLTLSPRLLARLITDTDLPAFFQDPEFIRLNPDHTFPVNGVSTPLIRAEGNADTWITTNWIASNRAASAFIKGVDPDGIPVDLSYQDVAYPTSIFENRALDDAYLPRQGQHQVVQHVFYGARPRDTSPLDPASMGFIGIVDLATAQQFHLPIARILNGAGRAVAPDNDSILAGYRAMAPGADATRIADPASTDPAAYPLVKIDYAMVPAHPDEAHLDAIKDLLTWGVTKGQTDLPPGYIPLPDALVEQTQQVAKALTVTTATTAPGDSPFMGGDPSSSAYDSSSPYSSTSDFTAAGAAADADKSGAKSPEEKAAAERERAMVTASSVAGAGARNVLPILLMLALAAVLVIGGRRAWPRLATLGRNPSASDEERPGASG